MSTADDVPQAVAEDATSANAVEHQVMDILNPSLHHHDLMQSYVRTRAEAGPDSKQDPEEFEEPSKEKHSGKYPRVASGSNARSAYDKGKRGNDKKEKKRSDATIDSEMRIQKSRRK